MSQAWIVAIVGAGLALIAGIVWRRLRAAQLAAQRRLASLDFPNQRKVLGSMFCEAAQASGKPRGLRWRECELHENALFAVDRASGQLHALVGATIQFEAIAGGGMEEVEAVGNLRYATAVFIHRQGEWSTDGLIAFNLEPHQMLEQHRESLAPLD